MGAIKVGAYCLALISTGAEARAAASDSVDPGNLAIEELGATGPAPASKQPEAPTTASAIYVITHDEILRSGAKTVAEALRLAPNLDVV